MNDKQVASVWSQIFYQVRVIFAAGAFAGFGLGGFILGLTLPLFWLAGGTHLQRRKRCQRIVGGSFRFFHAYMHVMGLIRYQPNRSLIAESTTPRVLVCNHPSLVDTTAVLAAYPEACCVVKSSQYRNPLYFLIMKFCGHICVNRESRESGALAVEEAAKRLGEGSDVLFFPEGTRSPGNEMGPFQAGAFAVAAHQGLPVLPVAIFCSRPVLKRGTPWYLIPNRPVELKLSPMGEVGAQEDESISSFARRVQSQLQTKLQDPPTSLLTS